jgi:hypothetical protein
MAGEFIIKEETTDEVETKTDAQTQGDENARDKVDAVTEAESTVPPTANDESSIGVGNGNEGGDEQASKSFPQKVSIAMSFVSNL